MLYPSMTHKHTFCLGLWFKMWTETWWGLFNGILYWNAEDLQRCKFQVLFFVFFLFCFVLFSVFWDRVSLFSPGCPGTHFVDQAGLEFRNPLASASRVLGLKACTTTPSFCYFLRLWNYKNAYESSFNALGGWGCHCTISIFGFSGMVPTV
jgi:hypothetical protein